MHASNPHTHTHTHKAIKSERERGKKKCFFLKKGETKLAVFMNCGDFSRSFGGFRGIEGFGVPKLLRRCEERLSEAFEGTFSTNTIFFFQKGVKNRNTRSK